MPFFGVLKCCWGRVRSPTLLLLFLVLRVKHLLRSAGGLKMALLSCRRVFLIKKISPFVPLAYFNPSSGASTSLSLSLSLSISLSLSLSLSLTLFFSPRLSCLFLSHAIDLGPGVLPAGGESQGRL